MSYKIWDYFVKNVTVEDADITNKLGNMYESEISEYVYDLIANNSELENKIAKKVISLVRDYEDEIKDCMGQFAHWYDDEELEKFDYRDALYNCDVLYIDVISELLSVDSDDLKYYEGDDSK